MLLLESSLKQSEPSQPRASARPRRSPRPYSPAANRSPESPLRQPPRLASWHHTGCYSEIWPRGYPPREDQSPGNWNWRSSRRDNPSPANPRSPNSSRPGSSREDRPHANQSVPFVLPCRASHASSHLPTATLLRFGFRFRWLVASQNILKGFRSRRRPFRHIALFSKGIETLSKIFLCYLRPLLRRRWLFPPREQLEGFA